METNSNKCPVCYNSPEDSDIESGIGLTLHEPELVNKYKNPNFDFQEFIIKVYEANGWQLI